MTASLAAGCGIDTRGRIEWIGMRPGRRAAVQSIEFAELIAGCGVVGDHGGKQVGGKRQVTLIQYEHLPLIARFAGVESLGFESLRRNLAVSGVNLHLLKHRRFRIGARAILEGTGDCHPCRRMEETIGHGGFSAMSGHGGITAIVRDGGTVKVGDAVVVEEN